MIILVPPGEFGIISSQSQGLRNRVGRYVVGGVGGGRVVLPITGAHLQI